MKRLIAVLLVLAALFSVTAGASAAFTDEAKIDKTYLAAVNAMSEKKIISGFEDGSFQPTGTLTRAQAAKILCVMLEGAENADALTAETSSFTDVPAGNWACKFVEYCAEKSIVSGVGGGKFNPNGKLTGAAFAKMLLVAYGADSAAFTGDGWIINVQKALRESGNNSKVSASDAPIQRQAACQMAYNFLLKLEVEATLQNGYTKSDISFAGGKNARALGVRTQGTAEGFPVDYAADGVEFTLDFGGDLILNLTNSEKKSMYFSTYVDGELAERKQLAGSATSDVIASRILPGLHTVRIVKDNEISTSGNNVVLTGITCACKPETLKADTAPKKLYIESIGDSITAGSGTLGTPKDSSSDVFNSASHSYGYLVAQLMDADYSLVAKGGIGITKPSGDVTVEKLFTCQQAFRSLDVPYSFSRKPDVTIVALGANDKEVDNDQTYFDAMLSFAKLVREKNGPQCKIVFIHNMMVVRHEEALNKLSQELGGAEKGYYTLKLSRGVSGYPNGVPAATTPHPSAEDQALNARELADFLKTIL